MSALSLAGLAMCSAAALFAIGGMVVIALRAAAIARRALLVESHPTVLAVRSAQAIGQRLSGLGANIARAVERLHAISISIAEVASAAAVVGLNVERVAFATRLLLQTTVPALRGALAEELPVE